MGDFRVRGSRSFHLNAMLSPLYSGHFEHKFKTSKYYFVSCFLEGTAEVAVCSVELMHAFVLGWS